MTRTVHTCWEGSYRSLLQLCSWALDEPRDQEPKNLLLTLQDVPVHPLDRPGTGILGVPAKQLECCALGLMLPAAWLLTCEMLSGLVVLLPALDGQRLCRKSLSEPSELTQ